MPRRILITGVNGFIGRSLWQHVRKSHRSVEVFGIDQHGESDDHIQILSLTDKSRLKVYIAEIAPQIIFHCAGGRMKNRTQLRTSNITTTKNLLASIPSRCDMTTRVIIPGSAAEYGVLPKNIRRVSETFKADPQSDYGRIKLEQSATALGQCREGLEVCVARIFNITGRNTPEQLAAGRFARQIVELERQSKTGVIDTYSLSGRRDFLDIDDVCRALWCLGIDGRPGEIYNVCSSQARGIEELLMGLIMESRLHDIEIRERSDDHSRTFDVVGSNAKLRRHTRWMPQVTWEQSLKQTITSYRKLK